MPTSCNCKMRKCPGQSIFATRENRDQLSAINYGNITESTMALVMSTCSNPTNFQLDWIERVKIFSFHFQLSNAKSDFLKIWPVLLNLVWKCWAIEF